MSYSRNALYRTIGISKQAVTQYAKRQQAFDIKIGDLIQEADELRLAHPGCGVEKMYHTLRPAFIGRDRFIDTFMELGYRIKRNKNYRITTRSGNFYYPNLIEGISINKASEIWQSDITYIRVGERFYYAVFIIDVYTKKIVGYSIAENMRATANIKALKMALRDHDPPKIHHSDRGSQYIYSGYTGLLKSKGTELSMGKIAQENAYAERINGTIKNDFLRYWKPKTYGQLKGMTKRAVKYYNEKRPHQYISNKTPNQFLTELSNTKSKQGPLLTIFKYQNT